jgi:hypothetical protein
LKAEFEELRLYDGTDEEYLNDLRHRMDEALNTMNDNNYNLLEGERVVEGEKARDEDLNEYMQARATYREEVMVTAIATEKGALDDQLALTQGKKEAWDTAKETLQTKTDEFNTANEAW